MSAHRERPRPAEEDLSVLSAAVSGALNARVRARLAAEGYGDARDSHGYLFQHLLDGPVPVGELARRLGVTQQAVSKAAGDLEALGYVRRVPDPGDQRVRLLALTDRGRGVIDAARRARRQLDDELREALGERRWAALLRHLRLVVEHVGAADDLRRHRLPPPT